MSAIVGSPGGISPRALPDPCVNLSIHTAPDVRPLRLCFVHGLLPLPDGFSWPVASAELTGPSSLLQAAPSPSVRSRLNTTDGKRALHPTRRTCGLRVGCGVW